MLRIEIHNHLAIASRRTWLAYLLSRSRLIRKVEYKFAEVIEERLASAGIEATVTVELTDDCS